MACVWIVTGVTIANETHILGLYEQREAAEARALDAITLRRREAAVGVTFETVWRRVSVVDRLVEGT
jgi:hypothetical protein